MSLNFAEIRSRLPGDLRNGIEQLLDTVAGRTSVSVKEYGALGNGVADDTAAIVAAIAAVAAAGGTVFLPTGIYPISAEIVLPARVNFVGAGGQRISAQPSATVLRCTAAGACLRFSGQRAKVADFEIDGQNIATHCLVLHSTFGIDIRNVMEWRATSHGVRLDTAWAIPAGNNGKSMFTNCVTDLNGGCGIAVPSDTQVDNNGLELYGHVSRDNVSHGLLWKGQALRLYGGDLSYNDGYGIQLGETADVVGAYECIITLPYMEGNTLGGLRGEKSTRNLFIPMAGGQGYSNPGGVADVELRTTSGAYGSQYELKASSTKLCSGGSLLAVGGFFEGTEIGDPGAGPANTGRLYWRDNGAGKTQLVVQFPTGAVQVIATQP